MPWAMRCSFSMSAKRTKPSPPGPNPTPGDSATSHVAHDAASRTRPSPSRRRARGSAPTRTSCRPAWGSSQPMRAEAVDQRVAPALVDRRRPPSGSPAPRSSSPWPRSGSAGTCRSRGSSSASPAPARPRRCRPGTRTRQPAIEKLLVIEYSSTAHSLAPSACRMRRRAGSRRSRCRRRRSRARRSSRARGRSRRRAA